MIKLIVFDLDDTLLDTSSLLIPIARTPEFYNRIKKPLPLMEGALENLITLSKNYTLALLTYGHVPSQQQKAKSLGIEHLFKHLCFADPALEETKLSYFKKLIKSEGLRKDELLSVGNRITTDIREAKMAGGLTCHFRYGEHIDEKGSKPEDVPDFTISHHRDLRNVCKL